MKTLIVIAFTLVAASVLIRLLPLNQPRVSVVETLGVVTLSTLFIFFGYQSIWTWSLARIIPALQSTDWPTVEGEMTRSSVREKTTGKAGQPPTHTFYPDIGYTYTVNGERFEGHNLLYEQEGPPVFRREEVEARLDSLRVGQTAKVFYDPSSPDRSCLKPGFYENPLAHALMNAFGVFLWVMGLFGIGRGVRLFLNTVRGREDAD